MMTIKTLTLDDQTYRRFESLMKDMMHDKKRDVDHSYVVNELINAYQDSLMFSGENAGG